MMAKPVEQQSLVSVLGEQQVLVEALDE